MRLRIAILAGVLAAGSVGVSVARASTLVSMSLDQLTEASSVIVQGQITRQMCRWNESHTQIMTLTSITVEQVYKGNPPSTVAVEQMGGTVGNMMVYVPGEMTFQPEGEYVLFLEPAPAGSRYRLVGMTQGAYRIYRDAATHQDRVMLPSFSRLQAELQSVGPADPPGTLPLGGFHKYVATIVDQGIRVPHGLAFSVAIVSTEPSGAGRMRVFGKTTTALFPNKSLVIPAGTEVEGEAVLLSAMWTIHWDELNVRGVHAAISATSEETEGSLPGRSVVLQVR